MYIMSVVIAIAVTFVVVSVWNLLATRKIRANQLLMVRALLSELDEMAKKLGHSDYLSYLRATKGEEYAKIASVNIRNLVASFTDRGV